MIHLMSVVRGFTKDGKVKIKVFFVDENEIKNADRSDCIINAEILTLLKTLRRNYSDVFDDALGRFLEDEIAGCEYDE